MSTNTIPNYQKAILTFNVFFREDTTTQSFLPSIVSKDTENWALFRSTFAGRKDCNLTIVDKSIETPFHCLLVALFCKQLEDELQTEFENTTMILSPTENRNDYLQECFSKVSGRKVKIATKRNPILCRDIKISTGDYTLFLRFEGGMANGWQVDDAYVASMTPKELLPFVSSNVKCKNIFTHGYSQNGVFINVDFLTKYRVCIP